MFHHKLGLQWVWKWTSFQFTFKMKMGVPVRGSPKQMMFFCKLAYWPGYILGYSRVPYCLTGFVQISLAHTVKLRTITPTRCSYAVFDVWLSVSLGMHIIWGKWQSLPLRQVQYVADQDWACFLQWCLHCICLLSTAHYPALLTPQLRDY